jgi:hypothetical protein
MNIDQLSSTMSMTESEDIQTDERIAKEIQNGAPFLRDPKKHLRI